MQEELERLRAQSLQEQAENGNLQQQMQERLALLEMEKQRAASASIQAIKQLKEEHKLAFAQESAQHQAALDDASKALAIGQV